MVKAEVIKLIEGLRILQRQQNKYNELIREFTREPRCKKGVLALLDEIDLSDPDTPKVFYNERKELAMKLTAGKSESNSRLLCAVLAQSSFDNGLHQRLRQQRTDVLLGLVEYVRFISTELEKSVLSDARERQTYLRRAVARLKSLIWTGIAVVVTKEQWATVEPASIPYLTEDLETLLKMIINVDEDISYGSIWWTSNGMDNFVLLSSMENYLDYLDSFLVY